MTDFFDGLCRFGGKEELELSDANRTLSEEEAAPRVLRFTGTLTATRTVKLPDIDGGAWTIQNRTTGGFALVVEGASGASTVTVPNGENNYVEYARDEGVTSIGGGSDGTFPTLTVTEEELDFGTRDGNIRAGTPDATNAGQNGQALRLYGGDAVLPNAGGGSGNGGQVYVRTGDADSTGGGYSGDGGAFAVVLGTGANGGIGGKATIKPAVAGGATDSVFEVQNAAGTARFRVRADGVETLALASGAAVTIAQAAKTATTATQAGEDLTLSTQPATAGSSTPGGAGGGWLTVDCGDAARLTSGDGDGGGFEVLLGARVGVGVPGYVSIALPPGSPATATIQEWVGPSSVVCHVAADGLTFDPGGTPYRLTWGDGNAPLFDALRVTTFSIDDGADAFRVMAVDGDVAGVLSGSAGDLALRRDGAGDGQLWVKTVDDVLGDATEGWARAVLYGESPAGIPASLDANHVYAYACEDLVGASELANSGNGSNGNLTLQGAAGTAYQLASRRLATHRNSVRFLADTNARGAKGGTSASVSGGVVTLEAYALCVAFVQQVTVLLSADAGANDYMLIGLSNTGGTVHWYAEAMVGGSYCSTDTVTPYPAVLYGTRQHVMATFNNASTPKLSLYVDGVLVTSSSTFSGASGALATMTRVTLGNFGPTSTYAFRGNIMQARVSNVARSAAYALAQAESCFAL